MPYSDNKQTDELSGAPGRHLFWVLFMAVLVFIIMIEGYYTLVLRNKIRKQRELSGQISLELQNLKNERDKLSEELDAYKILSGENKDGSTEKR
jgi:hypothetical protein